MKRTLTWSDDGSPTLFCETFGETYHSDAGAIEESIHVFLEAGLEFHKQTHPDQAQRHIVEYGFGTGLNVLLTLDKYIQLKNKKIQTHPIFFRTLDANGYAILKASVKTFDGKGDGIVFGYGKS